LSFIPKYYVNPITIIIIRISNYRIMH